MKRVALSLMAAVALAACSTTVTKTPVQDSASVDPKKIEKKDDDGPPDARKRATIRLQLATGYYQQGKFALALDELKQAVKFDPNFADVYVVYALVYTELNQPAQAEQSFQRAFQLEPGNSDVNNNYGWYLCQHGRERESLTYFENALKNPLYTQKAKPLQNAGVCASKMGDAALSEDYFRRSFEIDPSGVVAAYNLAQIYYQRQDYARARFYVGQVNNSPAPSAASLWLAIRIERHMGNKNNEMALENQLERSFADSREAQMQRRGNYAD
jgi:type IV pilus assembly protein PilF